MAYLEINLEVYCDNEYAEVPNRMKVRLGPDQVKRILFLTQQVIKLKVFCIKEFDYSPEWFYVDDKDTPDEIERPYDDGTVDIVQIKIMDDEFKYEGMIKHTEISIYTDSISINILKEYQKLHRLPKNQLPLYLNKCKYEENNAVVAQLIKGE